jgi:anti-anti-sigma factor
MVNPEVPARVFHVGEEDLGDAVIVTISGEVDSANVHAVKEPLHRWADAGRAHFVVDLRRVVYLDSLGITMLAQSFERARASGSAVAVISGERTAELLESLGLDADVSLVRSRDQALALPQPESEEEVAAAPEPPHRRTLRAARELIESGSVPGDEEELLRLRRALEDVTHPPVPGI